MEQAKAVAGEKTVAVASANVAQQCLDIGLLDAMWVNLVPVPLGKGIAFFENLSTAPVELEARRSSRAGVSHLRCRVRGTDQAVAAT